MRSWLFIPADSPRKLEKGLTCGADILILDLEDSVAPDAKDTARKIAAEFLRTAASDQGPLLYVRVNALDTGLTDDDLDAVMQGHPDGIMLPKSASGRDVTLLDAKIAPREALNDIEEGAVRIACVATETAAALFTLGSYAGSSDRLDALTWGAEDLSADLGATASRDETGHLTGPYQLARSLCLAGAVSAAAQPVDTVFVDFRNEDGLRQECLAAVRDGFTGKLAIHPGQIATINEAFTPSEQDIARAALIVDAFAAAPGAGVVGLDGVMLDRPHLVRAQKVLQRARLR